MTLHACFAIADWLRDGDAGHDTNGRPAIFFVPSRVFRGRRISLAVFDQEIAARSTKSRKKKWMTRTPLRVHIAVCDHVAVA
jgi:hypothetical protein